MFNVPKRKEIKPLVIEKFLGIDLSGDPTQIDIRRSPDMLNLQLDSQGTLEKRVGYEVFKSLTGKVNMITYFNGGWIVAAGTKLYKDGIEIYSGLADKKVRSFQMNSKLYILDGMHYLVYDGSTVKNVEDNAYIPTLTIGRLASGGGELYEQLNLLSPWVIDSFSADGTATQFQLSLKNLDADTVKATTDGVNYNKVETTDFTVNRSTGVVSWVTAPPQGINNVKIKYKRTNTGFADRIKKCTIFGIYGGASDSRVFVTGNPDAKNMDWRSELYDPSYFGENGFTKIGADNEKIMGYSKQYDTLVIHKEHSKWLRSYEPNATVPFPIKPVNDKVGLSATDTLQLIDNNPIGLTKEGVYTLSGGMVRDERNVKEVSQRVNPRLLNEVNLEDALSFDWNKKYGIAINGNVYVWDYSMDEWYIWDNINATCFYEQDGVLYFGSSDGKIYKFKKKADTFPYNDNGNPIKSYWTSKVLFGEYFNKKLIEKVYYTLKPEGKRSAVDLSYKTDKKTIDDILTSRIDIFNFLDFDFTRFSFLVSSMPQAKAKKIKVKKIYYFQMKLDNNGLNESMSVINVGIKFNIQGEVK